MYANIESPSICYGDNFCPDRTKMGNNHMGVLAGVSSNKVMSLF